jgi:hypothetical protein
MHVLSNSRFILLSFFIFNVAFVNPMENDIVGSPSRPFSPAEEWTDETHLFPGYMLAQPEGSTESLPQADQEMLRKLIQAIRIGYAEGVRILLGRQPALACGSVDGWAPLHYAALRGSSSIVRYLLGAGAFVNAGGPDGSTPLHNAVIFGHSDIAQMLLEAGACVHATHKVNGQILTPLYYAVRYRNSELIRLLVRYGARIGLCNAEEIEKLKSAFTDPLERAAVMGDKITIQNLPFLPGSTDALSYAAAQGQVEIVGILLGRGELPYKAYNVIQALMRVRVPLSYQEAERYQIIMKLLEDSLGVRFQPALSVPSPSRVSALPRAYAFMPYINGNEIGT